MRLSRLTSGHTDLRVMCYLMTSRLFATVFLADCSIRLEDCPRTQRHLLPGGV